jgi:hypothetical protein
MDRWKIKLQEELEGNKERSLFTRIHIHRGDLCREPPPWLGSEATGFTQLTLCHCTLRSVTGTVDIFWAVIPISSTPLR